MTRFPPGAVPRSLKERRAAAGIPAPLSPYSLNAPAARLKHLTVFIKQLAANRLGSAEQVGVYTSD